MVFVVLIIFGCVLHGFYRFVDIWLCVAWVLSCSWYSIVCCMGLVVLLIFDYVLNGSHRFVDIFSCVSVCESVCVCLCVAWILSSC